ncbi:glutathione hydrolase 1 proenzyme-like [Tubulanus polymorphus]|uniref:glutathione hydrolase 1 proenzyme-like n=1 Tax=Tubulanus polymorphus TaxID=672921 RepID=UPI003DA4C611
MDSDLGDSGNQIWSPLLHNDVTDDAIEDDNPFSFDPLYVDSACKQLLSEQTTKKNYYTNRRHLDVILTTRWVVVSMTATFTALITILSFVSLYFVFTRILPTNHGIRGPDLPYSDPSGCTGVIGNYSHGSVASDAAICSTMGSDILKTPGATAVDAAITTLLCNGVTHPHSSGIGGGMFMVIYKRQTKEIFTIDSRETAPNAVNRTDYSHKSSHYYGGTAIAIPGEIKGMYEAHQRFGGLKWSQLFTPVINLCEDGVPITTALNQKLTVRAEFAKGTPALSDLYIDKSTWLPHPVGYKVKRPKMAVTLRQISQHGGDEFYYGSLADDIVADIQQGGGLVSNDDISNYKAKWRNPVNCTIGGTTFYGLPPPASSVVSCFILNLIKGFYVNKSINSRDETEMSLLYHRIIEAFKFGYSKRFELSDEDFVDIKQLMVNLTSKQFTDSTRLRISDHVTHGPKYYGNYTGSMSPTGTTHISILAPSGDAVSVTSTINTSFGSHVVGNRTGIIFNNEMEDFSYPGMPSNLYHLPTSPVNFVSPGKRPMSSMSPLIGVDTGTGEVKHVTGASGGSHIISGIVNILVRMLFLGEDLKTAIDAPRIHHQWLPDVTQIDDGFPKEYKEYLEGLGHNVKYLNAFTHGATVQTVCYNKTARNIEAYCDIRKAGCPDGF